MHALSRPLLSKVRVPVRAVGVPSTKALRVSARLFHTQAPLQTGCRPLVNTIPPQHLNITVRRYAADAGEIYTEVVPAMGDSISEGTIQKWHKAVGDSVKVDDVVVSIETDKVVVEVSAKASGVITERLANDGDTVAVGKELFRLKKGAVSDKKEAPKAEAPKAEAPKAAAAAPKAEAPKAAPAAPAQATQAAKPATPAQSAAPAQPGTRERRVKMTQMRRRIAQRLKDSQNTAAMLTTFQECDMSAITSLRNDFQEAFLKKHGVKLGFMSAFVKASVAALQDQPSVNAVIDGDSIVYRDFYDISVAVATPRGLVVPVLRDCDKKSFAVVTLEDIEKELGALGTRARNDQITVEDMVGGTFTISNGGVYGSLMGTPIINPPQSAILGMHGITKRAIVVDNKIEIRPMMYLALTYDHRLIDGREAVTFLRKIKDVIEDPRRLLLDL